MRYQVVLGKCLSELNETVNKLLREGWEIVGAAFSNNHCLYQTMKKEEI